CGYRDRYEDFQALGVEIVGASFNEPADNEAWVVDQEFQYEVWRDDDKTLAVTYGSVDNASAFIPGRVTVILDADGTLMLEYTSVNVDVHPQQVLEDCQLVFD
ncbi:MAG: redoxin domain-containing protein, partial [Myxococcota bacterium]|nr:redoxin domain-containing protein [Myxococcota bacterium]